MSIGRELLLCQPGLSQRRIHHCKRYDLSQPTTPNKVKDKHARAKCAANSPLSTAHSIEVGKGSTRREVPVEERANQPRREANPSLRDISSPPVSF